MSNRLPAEARDEVHFRVLRLLEQNPDWSQRQMAQELGISLGRLHYCLKALMAKGLVKIASFRSSRHKLGYVHVLTAPGMAERARLTGIFLQRKLAEYDALGEEIAALRIEVRATGIEHPLAP